MHKVQVSKEFSNYYEIPGFSSYCVCSDDFLIFSRIRQKNIKFLHRGESTTLMNDIGKPHGLTYARALNLALNGPKENHNPMDKFIGKTSSKEAKWSEKKDQAKYIDPKKLFKARCVITGEEFRFRNISEVSSYFKISKVKLLRYLEESNPCIINNYIQLWQGHYKAIDSNSKDKSIIFIDDSTGKISIYSTLDLCVRDEFIEKEEILDKLENGNIEGDHIRCYYSEDFVIEINRRK